MKSLCTVIVAFLNVSHREVEHFDVGMNSSAGEGGCSVKRFEWSDGLDTASSERDEGAEMDMRSLGKEGIRSEMKTLEGQREWCKRPRKLQKND